MRRVFGFILGALLLSAFAVAGSAQDAKRNDRPVDETEKTLPGDKKPADATRYAYEFKQPKFVINHILIEHDASGRGQITFQNKNADAPIIEPIELSTAAINRIFGLWTTLHFLDSSEDYQSARDFSHLGTHRLEMNDGQRKRTAEFNWSSNSSAQNLAQEYRRVADQAIFVFDISVARENQPLNAPSLMNQLESLYRRNGLSDPRQLVPLLKELRTDEHIPLIARNQADRLLKKIEK
ncbi:MAG TPA: hypothetical protein VJT71_05925 [Pyrinomonadaceae bacterium]|nr:hypothetical protein [Pyrinomonadaceae bacterium]